MLRWKLTKFTSSGDTVLVDREHDNDNDDRENDSEWAEEDGQNTTTARSRSQRPADPFQPAISQLLMKFTEAQRREFAQNAILSVAKAQHFAEGMGSTKTIRDRPIGTFRLSIQCMHPPERVKT